MTKVIIPELKFTPWQRWESRSSIENAKFPGVYVLAITEKELEGAEVEYKDVCYIGMSNSKKGLLGRWDQFRQAIKGVKGRHSGGDTVFRYLKDFDKWQYRLYVAACPIACDIESRKPEDLRLMGIVAYLEYEAFAQFSEKHDELNKPKYNTK